jgi:tetratricopeptide (TPR) repeat protein
MFTRQGRNEEARAAFENSAMLLDRLIVEHPLIVDYQAVAAGNWLNIGSLEFSAGNWKQADIAWREAQRRYAALQSRNPNVPGYALDYAKSCSNLGNVCFMRQQYSACETYYADAIAVVEALVDSQPESVELRGFLVGIQSNLASAYQALKQDDKAISLYENAAHVQRQLVQSQPTVLEHQRRLAASLISLANVHHKMSSYASAETVIHEGCELTKRLVQEHADTPDYADMRGDALKLLGNILFDSDRFDEAVAAYQESLSVREQLARDHVEVALYRTKLGQVQFLLGRVAREMNRLEEAIDWFDRAIEQYQPIWQVLEGEGAAESKAIREALCDARWAKAGALYRLERGSDALVECDLALGYETGDYADGLHALRARVLARIGRMDEALHEAKSVDTSQNLSAPALVDLAAVYSLARAPHAQEPEYGSRCMELLRKAKAKSQRYMVGIEKDPDFKGLEGWDNAALTSPAPRP